MTVHQAQSLQVYLDVVNVGNFDKIWIRPLLFRPTIRKLGCEEPAVCDQYVPMHIDSHAVPFPVVQGQLQIARCRVVELVPRAAPYPL